MIFKNIFKKDIVFEPKVVFIGDSITEEWLIYNKQFFDDNNFKNCGISGQVTRQMLNRFRKDVIKPSPGLVVISGGTNDIANEIEWSKTKTNLTEMAKMAAKNNIKVAFCSIHPVYRYPWNQNIKPTVLIPQYNTEIKEICDQNNYHYVDYYSKMVAGNGGMRSEFTTDGVHCTKEGYAIMEQVIQPIIDDILQ